MRFYTCDVCVCVHGAAPGAQRSQLSLSFARTVYVGPSNSRLFNLRKRAGKAPQDCGFLVPLTWVPFSSCLNAMSSPWTNPHHGPALPAPGLGRRG